MADEVESFVASLSAADAVSLRALAETDRPAFVEHLKAAGFGKVGLRLKVESKLKELNGSPDATSAPSLPIPPPALPHDTSLSSVAHDKLAMNEAPAVPCADGACCGQGHQPDVQPTKTAPSFAAASSFAGARPGAVFKMGDKGVGYYRDTPAAVLDPAEQKLVRKHKGNLTWLSADTFPEEMLSEVPPRPDAPPSTPPPSTAAPASTALMLAGGYRPKDAPPGKLSEKQRAKLQHQAGPFDPPLRDGKYAEKGDVVKVTCGNARGEWCLVADIKMNQYTVIRFDGRKTDASMFHDLMTTDLRLEKFLKKKREWDARAPFAAKTLRDDMRGQIHSSWTPNLGGVLRLTDKASGKAKPGSGAGYHYAAVMSDQHTMPVNQPIRIDPSEVKAQEDEPSGGSGGAGGEAGRKTESDVVAKSGYYYAHRRKIDFKVPILPPQRLD